VNQRPSPYDSAAQSCKDADMPASASPIDNPLEAAARQLSDIGHDRELLPPSFGPACVGRMVVHIRNINRSVIASTQDHVNAAKRLNDFALVLARVAGASTSVNGEFAVRMTSVADHLRAAKEQLAGADAIPKWRAPECDAS